MPPYTQSRPVPAAHPRQENGGRTLDIIGFELVHHLGNAIFHAAVHVVGHETYHHVKHKYFGRECLANHDVSRALNESFIAALAVLEKQHAVEEPDVTARNLAASAFARLRGLAARYFPREVGPCALTEKDVVGMLVESTAARSIHEGLVDQGSPMPPSMERMLLESFGDAFSFAFKELGLKGNERVRAVIFQSMLADLRESAASTGEQLARLEKDVGLILPAIERLDSMRRFQERFGASIQAHLESLSAGVAQVASDQREIKQLVEKLVERSGEGTGAAVAYAVVRDADGNALARHRITVGTVTIGRDASNTIQVSHASVSSQHAAIQVDGPSMVLRDLGSKNGTFVSPREERIRQEVLRIGQVIRIGCYTIELQPPEAGNQPFMPGTVVLREKA